MWMTFWRKVCIRIRSGVLHLETFMVLSLQAYSGFSYFTPVTPAARFSAVMGLRLTTNAGQLPSWQQVLGTAVGSFQVVFRNAVSSLFVACFQRDRLTTTSQTC